MEKYNRTDLALERVKKDGGGFSATLLKEENIKGITVSNISVKNNGKEEMYVTISRNKIWDTEEEERETAVEIISEEIKNMIGDLCAKKIASDFSALIIGLGNADITADAIGPLTVKNLIVTRHFKELEPNLFFGLETCEVSAFSPGVLGQTGIETVELIRGAVKSSSPDIVIAVDALAARSCERLASVVQISNCGINPGSGIGNRRKAINFESIGVPVIGIGVPTVVNSSTLVYDVLNKAGIRDVGQEIEEVLKSGISFFVTPKESDVISNRTAKLIADSINRALDIRIIY